MSLIHSVFRRKSSLAYQCKLIGLLMFFLSMTKIYAQTGNTFDLSECYKTEIEYRLHPGEKDQSAVEIIFFMARPSFKIPEYSLSVVEINSKFYIRARILEKNLWEELSQAKEKKQQLSPVQTPVYSRSISSSFKDSLLNTFRKSILSYKKKKKPEGVICWFDGTVFEFNVFLGNTLDHIKIDDDLKDNDYEKKSIILLDQIINDLKDGSFDESKYKFRF